MAERSGPTTEDSSGGRMCDNFLLCLKKCRLEGIATIFRCSYQAVKNLKDALIVLFITCFIFAIWFMHLFNKIPKTSPERYCIRNDSSIEEGKELNKNNGEWLYDENGTPRLCWELFPCPVGYTCDGEPQVSLKVEYESFENIFTSFTAVIVVALCDFWESGQKKIFKSKGKWNTVFYVILIMVSYCAVTFILAVVSAAFNKVWKEDRKKKEHDKNLEKLKENAAKASSQFSDIPYIDNNESLDTDDKYTGEPRPKNSFQKFLDVTFGWQCCICCDKVRELVHKFIFDPFTQTAIVLCLIIQVGLMISDHVNMDVKVARVTYSTSMIFNIIFIIEAILKIIALSPKGYFTQGWNVFEFVIVVFATMTHITDINGMESLLKMIRLARFWPIYEFAGKMEYRVLKVQFQFFLTLGTFVMLTACAGMYIHGPDYETYNKENDSPTRWHMIDYGHSFMMVFRALCGEWVEGLSECGEISGWSCIPFYVSIILLGDFILVNLFTMFLLSEIVQKDDEKTEITSLVQIMNDCADRFINVWAWICTKLSCLPKCDSSANGHSKQSRISEATMDILSAQNGTTVTIEEGPAPCCSETCCNCLPTNITQSNCCIKLRRICYDLINNRIFEFASILVIVLAIFFLALQDVDMQNNPSLKSFLYHTNIMIPIVFMVEMIIRLTARGCNDYFKSGWRTLDFIVVLLSFVNMANSIAGIGTISFFNSLLSARLLRVLTLTWRLESARVVFNTLFESFPGVVNVWIIGFMEWVLFAIVGVQLFGGLFYSCIDEEGKRVSATVVPTLHDCMDKNYTWINSEINFDNHLNAFLALTQIASFKGWINIIHDAADGTQFIRQPVLEENYHMFMYFVLFIIFGTYYIYILWFSAIIDGFNRQRDRMASHKQLSAPGDFIYHSAIKNLSSVKPEGRQRVSNGNKLQDSLQRLTTSFAFDVIVAVLIVLNIIKLACHSKNQSSAHSTVLLTLDAMFIVLYAIELTLRVIAERKFFFKNWLNILDTIAVLLSIISVSSGNAVSNFIIPPMCLRLARLTQIIYNRKWTSKFTGFNCIISSLTKTIPYLLTVSAILGVLIIIYAIIGVIFFQNIPHQTVSNFKTFGSALTVLLQIFVTSGWDNYLGITTDGSNCHNDSDCLNPIIGVLYCVSFIIVTYAILFTTLTVIILEVYSETRAERKLLALLNASSDGFYQTWSEQDPTITGYIPLKSLSGFLESQVEVFKVSKPNDAQIAEMDIPIIKGDKVHHRDVLDALYRRVLANKGKPVSAIDNFEALPNTEQDYEPISSTLWRKREINCAKIIQRTWSRYKKQTRM